MDHKTIVCTTEKSHILLSLENLRKVFPDGTPDMEILADVFAPETPKPMKKKQGTPKGNYATYEGDTTPTSVAKYAEAKKCISSGEVRKHFNAHPKKAAGSLATLTRKKMLRRDGMSKDGTPQWRWIGSAKKKI